VRVVNRRARRQAIEEEAGMKTLYYLLDLHDDPEAIERYKAWHAPGGPPQAVNRSLRDAGIEELEIFLVGNRLMMALTPGPDFDAEDKARRDLADAEVQAWERQMWAYQKALPFAAPGEKWVRLERIYALSDQP
jgi:L-rhamnose mutarotase